MNKLNQIGLSLIEVMIALAVFSFGLLALAALMASGLKYNTSALHRSYATSQAYDMADRMRANSLGLESGYYDNLGDSSTVLNCPWFGSESDSDINNDCDINCSPEEMAQYDARQWNNYNACLLPKGTGMVRQRSTDPDIYTITVSWKTNMKIEDESFVFEFQP